MDTPPASHRSGAAPFAKRFRLLDPEFAQLEKEWLERGADWTRRYGWAGGVQTVSGAGLEQLAALSHLSTDADGPGLQVRVTAGEPAARFGLRFLGRWVHWVSPGGFFAMDRQARLAYGKLKTPLNAYHCARPLHVLMQLDAYSRGVWLTHGALVARGGAGIVLAGPAGSGKTTLALACWRSGWDFLAEDQFGLGLRGRAFSLWRSALLGEKKEPFLLDRSLARTAQLRAIVFCRVGRQTRRRAVAPGEALRRMLGDLARPDRLAFQRFGELVEGCRAWELELGAESEANVAELEALW